MVSLMPRIQEDLDAAKPQPGRRGRYAGVGPDHTSQVAGPVTAADFLVVQPLPTMATAQNDGDGEGGKEGGDTFEETDDGETSADEADEGVLPFDASTFATDLSQVLARERSSREMSGLQVLARFGIYHTSALVVAASNLVQEVGDISAAMAALRARVDDPEIQASVVPTDDVSDARTTTTLTDPLDGR
eukprot:COSAG05_NODE_1347_length_5118_cov_5.195258_8_plen_189_part_00